MRASAFINPLGWAIYLGMSWTWCIGMFLPVLLIRDFGPGGFWVFAIPNVLGAAAMGWFIRSRSHSEAFVERHSEAVGLFSIVTILFHVFFVGWIVQRLAGPSGFWIVAAIVAGIAGVTGLLPRIACAGALLISGAIALILYREGALIAPPSLASGLPFPPELFPLALICTLGFALCPYLDPTFHHAYQLSASPRLSFALGFGVFFASMIGLTYFYATPVGRTVAGELAVGVAGRRAGLLIACHMAAQSALTIVLHTQALLRLRRAKPALAPAVAKQFAVAGTLTLFAVVGLSLFPNPIGRFELGELVYRTFMACYGVLFPAYLLVNGGATKRSYIWWIVATLVALPLYALAFYYDQLFAGGLGAIVLLAFGTRSLRRSNTSVNPH